MVRPNGFLHFEVRRRRGFILVSVLLVSLFLVSSAVGYGWFVRSQVKRIDRRKFDIESKGIALLAVKNVVRGLASDKSSYDSEHEVWFKDQLIPLGDKFLVSVKITPLNDKLPLRHLFLPDGVTVRGEISEPWNEVWKIIDLPNLAAPALDFIDKDRAPRIGGYEKAFFPNTLPGDVGAFYLLPGVSLSKIIGTRESLGLNDLLTLWCGPKINVNTASAEVLSLLDKIDDVTAKEIVALRREKPFKNIVRVAELPVFSGSLGPKLSNILGTTSDYFMIEIDVSSLEGDKGKHYNVVVDKKSVLSWEER
ncbi:type II secretion system protein GspK [Dethiosulfovibrio sp. F2B]|uniref:general secretion pathway protein GspK n=1 Tax=Dethiosulfovibrio faecalis TaxID=2720018 RepID=UPI001F2F12C9|nr:type II secretion system protein GspK [Dethiosulfovibrio faecalis]MCF4150749.1 type II secretion system protein GspK [Dethiosulfovibrio faecalis]